MRQEKSLEIVKDQSGKPFDITRKWNVSLSHTNVLAAAAVSKPFYVGVDIEKLDNRAARIASRFLSENELEYLQNQSPETFTLFWSAKESLYKLIGQSGISFSRQLHIEPTSLKKEGYLIASINLKDTNISGLKIYYRFLQNHVFTLVSSNTTLLNL
ncbi:MAG: 4'-phosphopantetheinyl transferase superfamily protein [Chitinophagales bacterium]|nr:4'-phosphopantetheinyl transferase superfamily protein [Chitinophagales bacterium]